ncbi:MAG: 1-acyl-sn-glycerol-3-phosphate acyltransferase [Burkholderiales bacterium]|jgi:1-acyl-sn-glycerol-3-phosphate acyltransferase|nr:1-acyl-sn-glycerol-3-phosphate acyltransferase [Burkholderiales bacterium]
MYRRARAWWRLGRVVLEGLRGLLICVFVFPFLNPAQRKRQVGLWASRTLAALGVALDAQGKPRVGPVLLAANHVSWLDILAIDAVQPVRFVSKADVRHWPVLGWMIGCGGTLFIERERKRDAMRVVHQLAQALQAGETVAVFPEGTTSDGTGLLPFHANLLQAAISTETPVQAVALRYRDAFEPISQAAPYLGETTLAQSLWSVAMAQGLRVSVVVLDAQGTRHLDRRALAQRLRVQIAEVLGVVLPPA